MATEEAGDRKVPGLHPCKAYLCKMSAEEGHELCEWCERERLGVSRHASPSVQVLITTEGPKGLAITPAFRDHYYEKGFFIDRQVDAKGNVTTHPISKRDGTRVIIPMGR